MADPDNKAPAPAPAAAPVATPQTGTPASPVNQSLAAQTNAGDKDFDPGLKGPLNPNPTPMGAAPTKKFPARSSLITNPAPTGPDGELITEQAPAAEAQLSPSTLAEMEAGRKALEANKLSNEERLEAARRSQRNEDGTVRPNLAPTNPVDKAAVDQRKA